MKKSKLSVLIYGSLGEKNVGDEVILDQLLTSFSKEDDIVVISKNPVYTKKNFDCKAINEHHPFNWMRILKNILKLRLSLILDRLRVLMALLKCDLFVLAGGGIIVEVHQNELFKYLEICKLAKLFGKKVIVNCVGVGPLQSEQGRDRIKEVFNTSVDFISVRDQHSKNLLLECGVSKEVILTPDPAFHYFIPQQAKQKVCLINVCKIYKNSQQRMNDYILKMQELVRYIHNELGFKIKFVPFGVEYDRELSNKIRSGLEFDTEIHDFDDDYKQLTGYMGNATFSVTNRFHAGLISMVNGFPSFCIDHQFKAERLLQDMGLNNELLLPLADGVHRQGSDELDIDLAKSKIESMLKNEENICAEIEKYMHSKKEEVVTYRKEKLGKFIDSCR